MFRRGRVIGALAGLAILGSVFLPLPVVPFDVIDTSILLIERGTTQDEDVLVASESGRVEGRIDGDLVIATGDLTIDGVVTGDVFVISHGTVRIGGTVEGSVRGLVRSMEVSGRVLDDLAVVAVNADVTGSVGRDLLMAGGITRLDGGVGRDVRGRMFTLDVGGSVGRDVDVTVRGLEVGAAAQVGGDLLYRADDEAEVPDGASVGGVAARISARGSFIVRLYLTLAYAVGFALFILVGFLALWVFRASSARAAGSIVTRPGRTLLVGLVAGLLLPFVVVFSVVFAGSPLAAVVVGTVAALLTLVALVLGPVPALAAFGNLTTRSKAGLFGGFLVATVLWRLVSWLIPFVGAVAGLALYTWGVGGWLLAGWEDRKRVAATAPLGPNLRLGEEAPPHDWEPPLPPL